MTRFPEPIRDHFQDDGTASVPKVSNAGVERL
jgi:hypothetical protein